MAGLPITNPYKRDLIAVLHYFEERLGMKEEEIVIPLLELDTEEKITMFIDWARTKVDGEEILTKPNEIVRAACEISDGTMDLP